METSAARKVLADNPFLQLLGIALDHLENGEAICRLRAEEKHTRIDAFLHAGATASLIDTATAFAVGSILGNVMNAVTVDLTIIICARFAPEKSSLKQLSCETESGS